MTINKATKHATNPKTIPIAFDNVQELKDYAFLEVGDKVRTLGYYSPGDGGGNDYEVVAAATGTDDGGSYIDLAGSGHQAEGIFSGKGVTVAQFGAVGDGVIDDTTSVQNSVDYAKASGVRALLLGDHLVSETSKAKSWPDASGGTIPSSNACLITEAGTVLCGPKGVRARLICNDQTKTIIYAETPDKCSFYSFDIKGGYTQSGGAGHGIFVVVNDLNDLYEDTVFEDLNIDDVGSYGIGVNFGEYSGMTIDTIKTNNTGADGIDIKSRAPSGYLVKQNSIRNVTANNFGSRLSGSVGVDIRGSWDVSNIHAESGPDIDTTAWGVRLRPADVSNNVARRCSVSDIVVDCDGVPGSNGVAIQGVQCNIDGINVRNPAVGVLYSGSGAGPAIINNISNVVVVGHSEWGFQSTASGDNANIHGLICAAANGAAAHVRVEGQNNNFFGITLDTSANEFSITSGSVDSTTIAGRSTLGGVSLRFDNAGGRARAVAIGSPDDIDIELVTKGSGRVRFGEHQAIAGESLSGYIEMLDSGGNLRKIGVVS